MVDILIVLQTHSKTSANSKPRYCGESKLEISKRCVFSLFKTIAYSVKNSQNTKYKLIIVDDHSDSEFLDFIKQQIKYASFPVEVVHLETYGVMPSILRCYEIGKEKGKDLVYFAQDDYLYYETALWEMIDAYFQFTQMSGWEVCIFPYDDPYRYSIKNLGSQKIVLGAKRHWRTATQTSSCFMASHKTIVNNWDLFETMGKSEYDDYCEDKSINRLFMNFKMLPERDIKHLLFTPIPSLALHMGSEHFEAPYVDWKKLWDEFKISNKKQIEIPENKLTALNVGSGKSYVTKGFNLFTDDLKNHFEVRVDIEERVNPDIVANIYELDQIPNNSFDVVYSSHCLEHIFFHQIPLCLSEWYRVTKKGGEVRIVVPNLKLAAKLVVEGKLFDKLYDSESGEIAAIDVLYGYRKQIPNSEHMAHKTGFTKESLELILKELRYRKFSVEEYEHNILVRILKDE